MNIQEQTNILNEIIEQINNNYDLAEILAVDGDINKALIKLSISKINIDPDIAKELLITLIIEKLYEKISICMN